jgi:DNA ligase (NAD+)
MESLNPKETLSLAFKLEIYVSLRDLPTLNDERIANGEPPYSNCRSAASGIIGRLDNVYDRYLRFAQLGIAEVYDSYRNEHFNLARRLPARPFAKQLAPPNIYTTPVFPKCGTVAKQVYEIKNQLSRDRNECIANFTHPMCCAEAPMDGLVIYDADTFKELCAYKFDPESKTTRVVNVELNMGSTGAIVPTVILEPVVLNGTNQSRVGGTNFELIAERGIGPGAVVEISLNNDVIPYISQVLVPTRVAPHRPVFCPCCRHVLAREHRNLLCVNDNCEELRVQRLNSYIRSFMKNDGIGEAVARKLCAVPGFAPHHLYAVFANADIEYLRTVGLGDSVSTTLVNTGAELLRRPTADWEIVAALWFPGVGEKRAQKICSEIGIHSPECFAITGIDPRDVRLQSAYRELHAILQQLASFAIVASTYGKAQAYKLHVAITGTIPGVDRDALTLQLSNIGIKVSNAVTSKTQMLIVGDNPGRAKTTAAAKLGIPVYTYPQFVDYVRRLFTPNFSI